MNAEFLPFLRLWQREKTSVLKNVDWKKAVNAELALSYGIGYCESASRGTVLAIVGIWQNCAYFDIPNIATIVVYQQ